ncbi:MULTISPECIES: Arm DNA-binding domain-containing protein [unclassified Acinetobacter]|uniref:Arm DNA-binding domain-containing protein n=1 Tax=unclassified Acinetobacter TaxID=196816 RepID=UPI00244A37A5|nr:MULTISPECIES: Arm DNA-binding domain-containing protein [unclassified Acinetobacter]
MLTDAQVRKIKPLEKKAKYSDEKGMYLEVITSSERLFYVNTAVIKNIPAYS